MTSYVEPACVFQHEGQQFEGGGACYDGERALAYLSGDMRSIVTWHGERLGSARVVASWRTPQSFIGNRQYQVEATIAGVRYTGRTGGAGMLWRGKRRVGGQR